MFVINKVVVRLIVIVAVVDIIGNIHAVPQAWFEHTYPEPYFRDTICKDVGNPYYIQMIQINNSVVITWTPPQNSEECPIIFYVVFYINDHFIKEDTTKLTYYVFSEGLPSCSKLRVKIKIANNVLIDDFVSAEIETDVGSPYHVQMIQIDGNVVITWGPPQVTKNCNIEYEISFYMNDVFLMNKTTSLTYYIFNDGLISCSLLRIEIRTVSGRGSRSDIISTAINTNIAEINNITIANDIISWSMNGPTRCRFLVEVNDETMPNTSNELSYHIENLIPCKVNTITVTPIDLNDNFGIPQNIYHEPVPTVLVNFRIEEHNIWYPGLTTATWDILPGSCKIAITISDGNSTQPINVGTAEASEGYLIISDENFDYCISYDIQARILLDDGDGGSVVASYIFQKLPTALFNFRIEEEPNDTIRSTWDTLSGSCRIEIIKSYSGVEPIKIGVANASAGSLVLSSEHFDYCIPYDIQARFLLKDGDGGGSAVASDMFEKLPTKLVNFRIEEGPTDTITASWDILSGNCRIEITKSESGGETISFDPVAASASSLTLPNKYFNYCIPYRIQVRFWYSGVVDEKDAASNTYTRLPTELVSFRIEEEPTNTIAAKWEALEGECRVAITRSNSLLSSTINVAYASTGLLLLDNDNFDYCISYDVQAELWLTDNGNSLGPMASDTFHRRFEPIEAMDIVLIGQIVKVSWTLIENDISQCMFEGEFELECSSGSINESVGIVKDNSHQFTNCPVNETVQIFAIKITPILTKTNISEVSSVYCEYTVIIGVFLEKNFGSSSVCPLYVLQ